MATTAKVLFRGAASTTTTTTLYTVPSATTTIISNIAVTNTATADRTYTLTLDGVDIAKTVKIYANSTVFIDLKQVLGASDTIQGGASATDVNFHIAGIEIA